MSRQSSLPFRETSEPRLQSVLILSIRREHAERIYSGAKRFELRKQLPNEPFHRVYLYESGGTGLTGYFSVAGVLRKPLTELWDAVGELATTRERFEQYYSGWTRGCAIEVKQRIRFPQPVTSIDIRRAVPTFAAPQSFLLVRPRDPLHAFLESLEAHGATSATDGDIALRAIDEREHALYSAIVEREIAQHYRDIDATFAQANLDAASRPSDPFSFLTIRKEILSVVRMDGSLLGFTTLTYKHGGSVKTGPTVLLPEYRRRGYGLRVRTMLEAMLRASGARKLYATAPDVAHETIAYLLRSGMTIEAHLRQQYSETHGELVFGKFLASTQNELSPTKHPAVPGRVVGREETSNAYAADGIALALGSYGLHFPRERRREMARAFGFHDDYSRKPRDICVALSGRKVVASVVLSAKRGGALRGVVGTRTSHAPTLQSLLESAEAIAIATRKRKLYILHPSADPTLLSILGARGYSAEGLLRDPYGVGRDLVVMSRFFRQDITKPGNTD